MKDKVSTIFGSVLGTAIALVVGVSWQTRPQAAPPVPDVIPPQAPTIPQAPCPCIAGGECECKDCTCFPDYAHIEDGCRKQQKPCVVFVGVRPRRVEGFTIASQKTFCDDSRCIASGIVVGVWRDGMFLRHDLPTSATDAQIRSLLVPASAAGSSRPVGSYAPTGFAPVICRGGR